MILNINHFHLHSIPGPLNILVHVPDSGEGPDKNLQPNWLQLARSFEEVGAESPWSFRGKEAEKRSG